MQQLPSNNPPKLKSQLLGVLLSPLVTKPQVGALTQVDYRALGIPATTL